MDRLKNVVRSPVTANAVRLYLGMHTVAVDGVTPETSWEDIARCSGMGRTSAFRAAAELQRDGFVVRISDPWCEPVWRLT